ncbi:phenylacetic acid degradation protein PaaY [Meiothermus luteus]|uniref:Phenylacetic acid degradation protein PaaY n=1 Tax=Meiothermus luteus TaxID=2026184 RepID=A0A399ESK2_9DEIN|nr:hypothetical protein [Meiothermus luteus]RIH86029.1 phenylacetic acid degradation protein PaaY [Meiothermus luteus]
MAVYRLDEHTPRIHPTAFVAPNAVVVGQAEIAENASVWFGAVVPPGMEIPDGMLAIGIPAKVRGPVEPPRNAEHYVALSRRYLAHLAPIAPLGRYQLTLRGQDALNPFSDLHLQLKRSEAEALTALRSVAEGRAADISTEMLQTLLREGLIRAV